MDERCAVPRCRREVEIVYLGHGVCTYHWDRLTAEDAPPDVLKVVLGIEAVAPTAMEGPMTDTTSAAETAAAKENAMPSRKTDKQKTKSKAKKAVKAKAAEPKRQKEKGPKPGRVFAIRVTDQELAAIHKASGPRNATRFIRAVAAAFAKEDEGAFKAVLKEARELRS